MKGRRRKSPTVRIGMRLPSAQIERLKQVALLLGFEGYQEAARHCLGLGLQQVSVIINQQQQTSLLGKMVEVSMDVEDTYQREARDRRNAPPPAPVEVVVTPPQSDTLGTTPRIHSRRSHTGKGSADD